MRFDRFMEAGTIAAAPPRTPGAEPTATGRLDTGVAPGPTMPENTSTTLMYSLHSERILLAAALQDGRAVLLGRVFAEVAPTDFFVDHHGQAWACLQKLFDSSLAHDPAALLDYARSHNLSVGGVEFVTSLMDDPLLANPSDETVEACSKRIKDFATTRRLRTVLQQAMTMCDQGGVSNEQIIGLVEDDLSNIRKLSESSRNGPISIAESLDTVLLQIGETMDGVAKPAVPTGFAAVDALITGLADEDFVVIGARPSMGKTALLSNIAESMAAGPADTPGMGLPQLIFSLEMKHAALTRRSLSRRSGVNLTTLRRAELNGYDMDRISEGARKISELPIWIDDTPGLTLGDIRSRARTFVSEHGKCVIWVDYLQHIAEDHLRKGGDLRHHITQVSYGLKALARELKCPVVALAQLNRGLESRANKRPMMSDLRESGNIEQDADLIMFIYRDEVYHPDTQRPGVAEVIVAKQRDGAVGMAELGFSGATNSFYDL